MQTIAKHDNISNKRTFTWMVRWRRRTNTQKWWLQCFRSSLFQQLCRWFLTHRRKICVETCDGTKCEAFWLWINIKSSRLLQKWKWLWKKIHINIVIWDSKIEKKNRTKFREDPKIIMNVDARAWANFMLWKCKVSC